MTVNSGGSLQLEGGITLNTNNNITISGTGAGAIFNNDTNSDTVGGTVTLATAASINNHSNAGLLTLSGSVSL